MGQDSDELSISFGFDLPLNEKLQRAGSYKSSFFFFSKPGSYKKFQLYKTKRQLFFELIFQLLLHKSGNGNGVQHRVQPSLLIQGFLSKQFLFFTVRGRPMGYGSNSVQRHVGTIRCRSETS